MAGGDGSFERFYSASYRPLVRALVPVVLDVHAAEEIAQEAFLRAYRNWEKVSAYDDPRGWLYRVSMRLAIGDPRGADSGRARRCCRHGESPPVSWPVGTRTAAGRSSGGGRTWMSSRCCSTGSQQLTQIWLRCRRSRRWRPGHVAAPCGSH